MLRYCLAFPLTVCLETPSADYWKELAEQRRLALIEALSENKELCDLVEKLNAEIERLSEIEQKTEEFAEQILVCFFAPFDHYLSLHLVYAFCSFYIGYFPAQAIGKG